MSKSAILPADKHLQDIMIRFGKTLRQARKKKKMTLRELAPQLGISFGNLADIENGKKIAFCNSCK